MRWASSANTPLVAGASSANTPLVARRTCQLALNILVVVLCLLYVNAGYQHFLTSRSIQSL